MGRRLYARKPNGRFQRPTLENMLGLSAPPCPSCGRLNPHGASEPPPENCHACGNPMKPEAADGEAAPVVAGTEDGNGDGA